MSAHARRFVLGFLVFTLVPALAYAQASIVGVIKDSSGAVLPGVTVEAASPVLIEKVRSVVSDGTGQYRIVDLRPGVYTVTFTLPGFNTVKREGVELTGTFSANINADLRVGALEETITVTGETPVVDVQNTVQQRVVDRQIIDSIPVARTAYSYGVLIPGVVMGAGGAEQDVGGSAGVSYGANSYGIHGGRNTEQQLARNGVPTGGNAAAGYTTPIPLNTVATQEVTYDTAGGSGEYSMGGIKMNIIPREGGNAFAGTFLTSYANPSWQGDNLTPELQSRGLGTPDKLKVSYDVNPGFGGPIMKDRLWFFFSARNFRQGAYVADSYYDKNFNNPNAWTYDPDLSRRAYNEGWNVGEQTRLTWQVNGRNKIGISWNYDMVKYRPTDASSIKTPEAATYRIYPIQHQRQIDWTSPYTGKLLFEAGMNHYRAASNLERIPGLSTAMIPVTEQSTGLVYRAFTGNRAAPTTTLHVRAAASYITGTHAIKVGFSHSGGFQPTVFDNPQVLAYRFNNGVPNQITEQAYPLHNQTDVPHIVGLFAQDKWTIRRMTASYALRYDFVDVKYPEQYLGPGPVTPTRNITIPADANVLSWHDLTPHLGFAYDLFGNGKTAFKVSLNKSLENMAAGATIANAPNPVNKMVTRITRSWADANRNFIPDCDLVNPLSNGECGTMNNTNFGKSVPSETYDSDLMHGWGRRGFDWEFSAGVQHELMPRASLDVSYFRRWYGNFRAWDDRALAPSDFDKFNVTAPADPRLPNGGGYVVRDMLNLNPSKFGIPTDYLVTRASNYGKQQEQWNGIDVVLRARTTFGLLLQGGTSTGKTMSDICEILAKAPESQNGRTGTGAVTLGALAPLQYCHIETNRLTQVKLLSSYTIPRVDVLVSAALQSLPGPDVQANYNLPTAVAAQTLGRPLSGGAANVTLNLLDPGSQYGDRLNQIDLRFGKILKFGRNKVTASLDLFNALNQGAVLVENTTFGPAWRAPQLILAARQLKFTAQVDF